jgi:hypothetical protein
VELLIRFHVTDPAPSPVPLAMTSG